jgi:hypothetical protein
MTHSSITYSSIPLNLIRSTSVRQFQRQYGPRHPMMPSGLTIRALMPSNVFGSRPVSLLKFKRASSNCAILYFTTSALSVYEKACLGCNRHMHIATHAINCKGFLHKLTTDMSRFLDLPYACKPRAIG